MNKRIHEAGQATVAIVLVTTVLLLIVGFLYTFRLAKLEDEARGLQTAADAAALAGAQSIVRELPTSILSAMNAGTQLPGGLGQQAAGEFAARNGAELIWYVYRPAEDRIEVRVRSTQPLETGQAEEALAWARIGRAITACSRPAPPDTVPTPASYRGIADCGELSVPVEIASGTGQASLTVGAAELTAALAPALSR